jgi:amino acid transporter
MEPAEQRRPDPPENEPSDSAPDGLKPRAHHAHRTGRALDLREVQVRPGTRAGNQRVRIVRPFAREFRHAAPGHLVATEQASQARGGLGGALTSVRRFLVGRPIATEMQAHERLTKLKALAVFSSDALSSVAYATDQILFVLAAAGTAALGASIYVAIAITFLLAVVALSYRQTIHAYPNGGGSYIVASDNLGRFPGLVAAAALLIDYVLTVAVSVSAGILAVTSAFQNLAPYATEMSIAATLLIMVANLRGVRESGTIFMLPTYIFVASVLGLIAFGTFRVLTGTLPQPDQTTLLAQAQPLSLFLLLSAFANGCTALTGVEAVSNGVPAFKRPESRNAATTLTWMAILLGVMFLGITFLAHQMGLEFDEGESILSQMTRALVGTNVFYFVVQGATMLILVLAANTSFADFPRLSSILARDGYLPHQFSFRGDRLAFTTGILVLAGLACVLIAAFRARVEGLIPLYAVGVFLAFTLSQAGMVKHWWTRRERGWQRSIVFNAVGAVLTAVVAVIFLVTKFEHGAWIVTILMPILVVLFLIIHRHYRHVADELTLPRNDLPLPELPEPAVLVPVAKLDRATLRALAFAHSISRDVTAVHVTDSREEAEAMREQWENWESEVGLVILESPYRALLDPLVTYIKAVVKQDKRRPVTVVLSEFVPRHWWEYLLHNQTALRLKFRLFFMPNTVVVDLPYHLGAREDFLELETAGPAP